MSSVILPRFVALKSNYNNKYLLYVSEKDAERFRFVQSSGEQILSPNVKFDIESATTGNGLVHIRSSYSNKYMRRWGEDSYWIVAGADKTEEDQSKWGCTLFEPTQVDDSNGNLVIRLRHVQLNHYLLIFSPSESFSSCVFAYSPTPWSDNSDLFTVTNWETLVELPRFIAIKGDNEKYLSTQDWPKMDDYKLLLFKSTDIGDKEAKFEVFPNGDGIVMIKNYDSGYWFGAWEYSDNHVHIVLANDKSKMIMDSQPLFQPVYVADSNVIALKSLRHNCFCSRSVNQIVEGFSDSFASDSARIIERAKLTVEVPLLRRTITITYRLDDASIYDLSPVTLFTSTEDNHESEPVSKHITLNYKTSTTTNWQGSVSLKVGFKFTIEADFIPFISKSTLELSGELAGSYEWGESTETETTYTDGADYTIKPMHKLTVRKIATKGHCNVPYSYTQTDYLLNGDVIGPIQKEDGVFTGANCFDIYTDSYQEPINP